MHTNSAPKVYLSHVWQDSDMANLLKKRLTDAGFNNLSDSFDSAVGSSLAQDIQNTISAVDYLIILISPAAIESVWLSNDLEIFVSKDLQQKSVTVIPFKVKPCIIPTYLRSLLTIDATYNTEEAIQRLINVIGSNLGIDFKNLAPHDFEMLILDLLRAYRFSTVMPAPPLEREFDFLANFETSSPFGETIHEDWLIEVRSHRNKTDLKSLHAFADKVKSMRGRKKGLLVTSSQLTSAALEWLHNDMLHHNNDVRVIDGMELRRMVLLNPPIANKYFGIRKEGK